MRRGKITLKFKESEENLEQVKTALYYLNNIGCVTTSIIRKVADDKGNITFDFIVDFEKFEYENDDKTALITIV